jgi:hypothetical protein
MWNDLDHQPPHPAWAVALVALIVVGLAIVVVGVL